ncbi:hypothetical protein B0H11DRAFT_1941994 [Mycena galericulata]|nr:hypothetical protein B0H11DRAFT_1941994 [Mycena galericulata]
MWNGTTLGDLTRPHIQMLMNSLNLQAQCEQMLAFKIRSHEFLSADPDAFFQGLRVHLAASLTGLGHVESSPLNSYTVFGCFKDALSFGEFSIAFYSIRSTYHTMELMRSAYAEADTNTGVHKVYLSQNAFHRLEDELRATDTEKQKRNWTRNAEVEGWIGIYNGLYAPYSSPQLEGEGVLRRPPPPLPRPQDEADFDEEKGEVVVAAAAADFTMDTSASNATITPDAPDPNAVVPVGPEQRERRERCVAREHEWLAVAAATTNAVLEWNVGGVTTAADTATVRGFRSAGIFACIPAVSAVLGGTPSPAAATPANAPTQPGKGEEPMRVESRRIDGRTEDGNISEESTAFAIICHCPTLPLKSSRIRTSGSSVLWFSSGGLLALLALLNSASFLANGAVINIAGADLMSSAQPLRSRPKRAHGIRLPQRPTHSLRDLAQRTRAGPVLPPPWSTRAPQIPARGGNDQARGGPVHLHPRHAHDPRPSSGNVHACLSQREAEMREMRAREVHALAVQIGAERMDAWTQLGDAGGPGVGVRVIMEGGGDDGDGGSAAWEGRTRDHLYYIAIAIHDHFLVDQLAVIVQMAKCLGTNNLFVMFDYDSTDLTETLTSLCEAVLTLLSVPFCIHHISGVTEDLSAAYYPLFIYSILGHSTQLKSSILRRGSAAGRTAPREGATRGQVICTYLQPYLTKAAPDVAAATDTASMEVEDKVVVDVKVLVTLVLRADLCTERRHLTSTRTKLASARNIAQHQSAGTERGNEQFYEKGT